MNIVEEVFRFFLFGAMLGLSASLDPGPFSSLVISQTMKHGFWEGVKVTLSVLFTDVFFVSCTVLLLLKIGVNSQVMGIISLFGGCYLLKLAYDNLTDDLSKFAVEKTGHPQSFLKGAILLFLDPGSYFFWIGLAGPILVNTFSKNPLIPGAFLIGIYTTYIGTNVLFAASAAKSKFIFKSKLYAYALKFFGIAMVAFALKFFWNGLGLLGILGGS